MPLNKICLSNFKKHRSLEAEFSSGLNLVVGPNYSGKSTLLQAVLYALFGASAVPGGIKAVKTQGKRNRPVVELEFTTGGHSYQVFRSGSSAKLLKGGELEASGQSIVTKAVESLFGMTAKTFSLLRTSPQDEAQAILTLGSAKLGALVNEVTRIDVIDKVIAIAKSKIPASGEQVIQSTKELETVVKARVEDLNSLQGTINTLKTQQEVMAERTESATAEFALYQNEYLAQQKAVSERARLEAKISEIDRRGAEIGVVETPPESALQEAKEAHASASEAANVYNYLRQEEAAIEKGLGQKQREYARLEALFAELKPSDQPQLEQLKAQAEFSLETLNNLTERKAPLYAEYVSLGATLENAVCQTCHRPFDQESDFDSLRNEYATLSEDLAELQTAIQSEEANNTANQQALSAAEAAFSERQRQASGLKELGEEVATLEQTLQKKREDMPEPFDQTELSNLLGKIQELAERVRAAQALKKELKQLLEERGATETRLGRLLGASEERTADVLTALQEQAKHAKENADRASATYHHACSEYATAYQGWEKLDADLVRTREQNASAKKLNERYALLRKLVKYLRKNRDRFTEDTWNSLLTYATEFASISTNGDIVAVTRSADGDFQFDEGNGSQPLVGASGVQKAILGVGVRLALAEALNSSTDFMLLDEVTAGATDDVSLSMTQALSVSGLQILSVTHREADASIADAVIQIA